MAIGRISGPLLKADLLREGVNLAFETDLLYLDVVNSRIGINTASPQYELDVNGVIRSTGLQVSTLADIADITVTGSTIETSQPVLTLGTADTVVYQNKLTVDSIDIGHIDSNVISTNGANTNLELNPNGTGTVEIFADTNVYGDIVATGSVIAEGNITIGDANTDNVTFNAEITSDIIPDQTNTYSLGKIGQQWQDVWVENFFAGTINTTGLEVDGVDLALRQGNIFYVAENGDDTYSGDHPNDPFGSVKYALSQASAGDTVHIYPGVYTEEFPITVPVGVTLKGHSLRSVNIQPTVATQNNDAFLLNGEVTIEDVTIRNFFSPGYAFKFAPGFTVTSRSPYIKNISVITAGSVTSSSDPRGFDQGDAGRGAYLDGAVATASSREAACLFHSVTFITPGVDAVVITNGTRVEWLNCFTYFANRGLTALDGATGLKGAGKTSLRVEGVTGSYLAGETVTYYDTDGTTVLATGTIDSVDTDGKFYINGKQTGFETFDERLGKIVSIFGNAYLDNDQKQFGSTSLKLDGSGDYLKIASSDNFGFNTGDFTVESWIYKTSSTGLETILDFRVGSTNNNALTLEVNGLTPRVYVLGSVRVTGSSDINLNQWNHVAYVRSGSTGTLYLNGQSVGSWTDNTDYGTAKSLAIGSNFDGLNNYWDGWLDEIRISKGVARYTGNFAVPSSAFTSDEETVLLLHLDGDDSSSVIVDDANIRQDIRFSGGATANFITLADFTDFGGEIRSIASASVYGNIGAYGDGPGVLMYLISQNFAYIGNGKDSNNDPTSVLQDNEVVEINDAKIRYSSVDHKGDFRVGDLFYVNQETGEITFTNSDFNIETSNGISITTNGSTTNITGEKIDTGNLRISGNTIESLSGDINIEAASGTVRIDSTGALNLPTGTTAERPVSPELGMIRYNTDDNLFEGYNGSWLALNGVYDLDRNTRITAELTPGANDKVIRFYADDVLVADLDQDRFRTNRIEVDEVYIDGNVIGTLSTNNDLQLTANGAGSVVIDDLAFKDSSITNISPNGITLIRNTGSGYFKFEGTGGMVIPVGNDVQRPLAPFLETGMMRYNINQQYVEIYDGTSWVSVAGSTGSINFNQAENLAIEYVLTLG
jgi:hypothetical protein